jgi:(p)ppGpp synthase/HD superfamily hydrolase
MKLPITSLDQIAKEYAIKCHQSTNHFYDGQPYEVHLSGVEAEARNFMYIFDSNDHPIILAGCWVHDVIEDTRQTFNNVKDVCGPVVADIAYALTNQKGRNRKERANFTYYNGILNTRFAPFIKVCDRLANTRYSLSTKSSMLATYQEEYMSFERWLRLDPYTQEALTALRLLTFPV